MNPPRVGLMTFGDARDHEWAKLFQGLTEPRHIENVYRMILHRGLSVRQVEAVVRRRLRTRSSRSKPSPRVDPEVAGIEESLMRKLGTRVRVLSHGGHGKIEIEFYSNDDLTRIIEAIG